MNRRGFLKAGATGLAVSILSSGTAQAHHASEPAEPIIGVKLDLYRYPDNTTKIVQGLLIPESGTQPPSGVSTFSTSVEVLDRVGGEVGHGAVVSTIPAVGWFDYKSSVTFDPATGLPIIPGNLVRIEPFVSIRQTARSTGLPSEHWNSTMTTRAVTNNGTQNLWDTLVRHANVGPHGPNGAAVIWKDGFHEVEQDNDYPHREGAVPGDQLVVEWLLEGAESKRRFRLKTKFIWGG